MPKAKNTHERFSSASETKLGSARSFGFVFAFVFVLLGFWQMYQGQQERALWMLGAAGILALVALTAPNILQPFNIAWFRFGLMLHKIISPIILGLLFFVTVTPIALILRALDKDLLNLRLDPKAKSYWIHRHPPGPETKSMSNQF